MDKPSKLSERLTLMAQVAEVVASIAIVVTLIVLVAEVRGNTLALQRQTFLDRATAQNAPFLENPAVPRILTDIKEVDGWEGSPFEMAFVERYGLPEEDALVWGRVVAQNWAALEADYTLLGASPALESRLQVLLAFPDFQMLFDYAPLLFTPEFRGYVDVVREGAMTQAELERTILELRQQQVDAEIEN